MYSLYPCLMATPKNTKNTHSGHPALVGMVVAVASALTQPSVASQFPGKVGAVLGGIGHVAGAWGGLAGMFGAIVAAASMPPGSPKVNE